MRVTNRANPQSRPRLYTSEYGALSPRDVRLFPWLKRGRKSRPAHHGPSPVRINDWEGLKLKVRVGGSGELETSLRSGAPLLRKDASKWGTQADDRRLTKEDWRPSTTCPHSIPPNTLPAPG